MYLDVTRLPRQSLYQGSINLASVVWGLRTTIDEWAASELVKPNDSFGFAMANADKASSWDDPYAFVDFVVGWGPQADRYIANAVRKLRAALRTTLDTLFIRINNPDNFRDVVESQEADGSFAWGDFPCGGATFVRVGDLFLPCAVSALKEVEDDAAAKSIGGHVGAMMLKIRNPDEFA
jgi:hypothetical protein